MGGRSILCIAWPEPGHLASPVALALELRARGDRVVFAGAPAIRSAVASLGLEFCNLSPDALDPRRASVFARMPGLWGLRDAVDHLETAFVAAVEGYRPSFVLLDSLYSALGILAEARGLPWGIYETDLPRELDAAIPPPSALIVPDGGEESRRRIRRAWAERLSAIRRARRASRHRPVGFAWSMASYFPDALEAELKRRTGVSVTFNRRSEFPPVAEVPRLVFCPSEFDFLRSRTANLYYVGSYINEARPEPAFDWSRIPSDLPLAYCSLGTQTHRSPEVLSLLSTIARVFSSRRDYFLVLACPPALHPLIPADPTRVLLVSAAPQLSLLRRARLALTHGGFNSVKECAWFGVPNLVLPLSHDQPRNAALVAWHGIGMALEPSHATAETLQKTITELRDSTSTFTRCRAMSQILRDSMPERAALSLLDRLMVSRAP